MHQKKKASRPTPTFKNRPNKATGTVAKAPFALTPNKPVKADSSPIRQASMANPKASTQEPLQERPGCAFSYWIVATAVATGIAGLIHAARRRSG